MVWNLRGLKEYIELWRKVEALSG